VVRLVVTVDYSLIILLFILSLLLYVKLNKIVQEEKSSNLPMVSESLTLTFNLLTGHYSSLALPPSFRLDDVIFWELECVGVTSFLRFSRRRQHGSARIFLGGGLGGNT